MDKIRLSTTHQKAKGTYPRNQDIRLRFRGGESYAEIGRWYHLTRQAVRAICNQKGE